LFRIFQVTLTTLNDSGNYCATAIYIGAITGFKIGKAGHGAFTFLNTTDYFLFLNPCGKYCFGAQLVGLP